MISNSRISDEMYYTIAFLDYIQCKGDHIGIPLSSSIATEVPCRQGVVDILVSLTGDIRGNPLECVPPSFLFQKTKLIRAYSNLHHSAIRSSGYLAARSGLSKSAIERILGSLVDCGYVDRPTANAYRLSQNWNCPRAKLLAIEVKMSDWKRALFQTLQYKAFSHQTLAVFPSYKRSLLTGYADIFKSKGTGLFLFDPERFEVEVLVKPRSLKPISLEQYYYAYFSAANILSQK